ncbi:MAG: hypothetical protein FWG98_02980 [Candidatus Cloacimonetes bacterium]|nr:hypothetical protein [Candidatus Cloacimonadota bacterium]
MNYDFIDNFFKSFNTRSPFKDEAVIKYLFENMKSHKDLIDLYKAFMIRQDFGTQSFDEIPNVIIETAKAHNPYLNKDAAALTKTRMFNSPESPEHIWLKTEWQYYGGFIQIQNKYFSFSDFSPKIRIYLSLDYNFLHKYFIQTFMLKVMEIEIEQSISTSGKCPCIFKIDCGFADKGKWFKRNDNVVIYTIERFLPFIMKALNDTFDSLPKDSLVLENQLLENNVFPPAMTCHQLIQTDDSTFLDSRVGFAPELSGTPDSYNRAIAQFLIDYKQRHRNLDFDLFKAYIQKNIEIAKNVNFEDSYSKFKLYMLQPLLSSKRLHELVLHRPTHLDPPTEIK